MSAPTQKASRRARRRLATWAGGGVTAALMAGCASAPPPPVPVSNSSGTPVASSPAASRSPSAAHPSSSGGGAPGSLAGFFPIGAYVQAPPYFGLWKRRGINTMVDVPQGTSEPGWNDAAVRDGLDEIRAPGSDPARDAANKHLLAWALQDQPDDIGTQVPYTKIQQTYRSWKRAAPRIPVYINFNGQLNQYDVATKASGLSWYQQYAKGADWITADLYPVNSREGNDLGLIGREVDELRQVAGSKPVFVFIESGAYDASNPVITPDQFRGEVWEAIIHGVRGIFYFPVQVSPSFKYDVTPPAVAAEMTAQDATITKLAGVLQGEINPPGLGATAPAPLQVGWRSSAGRDYFFVLNLSATAARDQTISLSGVGSATTSARVYGEHRSVRVSGGTITDSFGPYAIHIYEIPAH